MARQQSSQAHPDRKQQAPPAPTSGRPPFPLGASSPHGIPQAYGKSDLTQEKLKFPASKKRKGNQQGSNASTPVPAQASLGPASSPPISKPTPPDAKTTSTGMEKPAAAPTHLCPHADCPFHLKGFESAEELAKHETSAHEIEEDEVIDDPVQHALEAVAEGLGLNKDGTPKAAKKDAEGSTKGGNLGDGQPVTATRSKSGQTPATKPPAHTPLGRLGVQMSQDGGKSTSSAGFSTKTPQGHQAPDVKLGNGKDDKKVAAGYEPPFDASWEDSTISLEDLRRCFGGLEHTLKLGTFNKAQSTTPKDTPSSKGEESSPNSNISENDDLQIKLDGRLTPDWNPFGIYDDLSGDVAGMNVDEEDIFEMDWDAVVQNNKTVGSAWPGTFINYGIDAGMYTISG